MKLDEILRDFGVEAFTRAGMRKRDARVVADALIHADLRGVHSHGVRRIPHYVSFIEAGNVNPRPNIMVIKDSGATALIDGDMGQGQLVATKAMKLAISKAEKFNVGTVAVRRSTHLGCLAPYLEMAIAKKMIGFATTNAHSTMPAYGGATALVGNNPVGFGIPAGKHPPLIYDAALSVASYGKVAMAIRETGKIPHGWMMDSEGQMTTDPAKIKDERLQVPIGGYKGFSLALVAEVLTGVLSGSVFGPELNFFAEPPVHTKAHFFMALKIDSFMPYDQFIDRMDKMIGNIKNSKKAKGVKEVYYPGERSHHHIEESLKKELKLPVTILEDLQKFAQEYKLPYNLLGKPFRPDRKRG